MRPVPLLGTATGDEGLTIDRGMIFDGLMSVGNTTDSGLAIDTVRLDYMLARDSRLFWGMETGGGTDRG